MMNVRKILDTTRRIATVELAIHRNSSRRCPGSMIKAAVR
jgi:hypothetical protein